MELSPSTKRLTLNLSFNAFGQAANFVAQLVLIPFFLRTWTKEEYGEWLVLTAIPSILWSLDAALSVLAGNTMTIEMAAKNKTSANAIFQSVLTVQCILGIFIVGGVSIYGWIFNLKTLFGFSFLSRIDTTISLVILLIYMFVGFYLGLLRAVYRACGQEVRGIILGSTWRLIESVVVFFVLQIHGGVTFLTIIMLLTVLIWVYIGCIDIRLNCREIPLLFGPVSSAPLLSISRDGFPLFADQLAIALFLQGFPLLIYKDLGSTAVITLNVLRASSRIFIQYVLWATASFSPELSKSYGEKNSKIFKTQVFSLIFLCFSGGLVFVLLMTLAGPLLISVWTKQTINVSHFQISLFITSVVFQGAWIVGNLIMTSINRHHYFSYISLAMTLIGLSLVGSIIHNYGFNGVPLTMILIDLSVLIISILLFRLDRRAFWDH